MKLRKGFVSNSSTSSFIVATKDDIDDVRVKLEIPLRDAIEKMIIGRDLPEFIAYLKHYYHISDPTNKTDEEVLKYFGINKEVVIESFKQGKTLMYCTVATDIDNPFSTFLCDCDKDRVEFSNSELIWREGSR